MAHHSQRVARQQKSIVFFDGQCNLCNRAIDFILQRDLHRKFTYCSLQSAKAREMVGENYNFDAMDGLLLLHRGQFFNKSSAALIICGQLTGNIRCLRYGMLIPLPLRDFVYSLIARYRYQLFGKRSFCRLPKPDEEKYFIC